EDLMMSVRDPAYARVVLRDSLVAKYGQTALDSMESHHGIPVELLKDPEILAILREAAMEDDPFWFNGPENGKVVDVGHGPHPRYTAYAQNLLLRNYTGTPGGTSAMVRWVVNHLKTFDPMEL